MDSNLVSLKQGCKRGEDSKCKNNKRQFEMIISSYEIVHKIVQVGNKLVIDVILFKNNAH